MSQQYYLKLVECVDDTELSILSLKVTSLVHDVADCLFSEVILVACLYFKNLLY